MAETLKQRVASGILWNGLSSAWNHICGFVISVILARLLDPQDFGIIAITSSLIFILSIFLDVGFGAALVQKKDIDDVDIASVFFLNIGVAFILYVILFFSAYFIADFYKQPELRLCVQILSLTIPIRALSMVQGTLIYKRMEFALSFRITFISVLISGTTGIIMALCGLKYWALIFQQILNGCLVTAMQWIWGRWRPKLLFDIHRLKGLFQFGGKLFIANTLESLQQNLFPLAIGKIYSLPLLSYYNRGQHLIQAALGCIYGAIGSAFFPILSDIQDDNEKLKQVIKNSEKNVMFFMIPAMLLLVAISTPFILVIYGEKWLAVAPFLKCFALNAILFPLSSMNLQLLMAKGRSDTFLILEIIKKVLIVIIFIVLYRYGIFVLLCGQICFGIIAYFLNSYYTKSLIDFSSLEQLKGISFYFLAGIISLVFSLLPSYLSPKIPVILNLILTGIIFSACYLGSVIIFRKIPLEIIAFLAKKIPLIKAEQKDDC